MYQDSISVADIKTAGYTPAEVHGVLEVAELHGIYSAEELHGVYAASELQGVYSATDLHGVYTAQELHGVYTPEEVYGVYTPEEIRGVYTAEEMLGDIVEQTAQTLAHYDRTLADVSPSLDEAEALVQQMRAEAEQASQAAIAELSACAAHVEHLQSLVDGQIQQARAAMEAGGCSWPLGCSCMGFQVTTSCWGWRWEKC